MNANDGLAFEDIDRVLGALRRGGVPLRQIRLWGCGVARRLAWNHMIDGDSTRAVEIAERYAEGQVEEETLTEANRKARDVYEGISLIETVANSGWAASRLAAILTRVDSEFNYGTVTILSRVTHAPWRPAPPPERGWVHRGEPHLRDEAETIQLEVLREIIGPISFLPVTLNREVRQWHDGLVVTMAEGIVAGRDWDHLPVLADALEDAGCEESELLEHLRSPGPHHVGCWAIESILDLPRWQPVPS